MIGQLVKFVAGKLTTTTPTKLARPLAKQETYRPLIARNSVPDFFQDEPLPTSRPLSQPIQSAAQEQPQDWQEAKRKCFELAKRVPGLVIGQLSDGTKTLQFSGNVRTFASWLAVWTALQQATGPR